MKIFKLFKCCIMLALSICVVSCGLVNSLLSGLAGPGEADDPVQYSFVADPNTVDVHSYYALSRIPIKFSFLGPTKYSLSHFNFTGAYACDDCGLLVDLDLDRDCTIQPHTEHDTRTFNVGDSCSMIATVGSKPKYIWQTGIVADNPQQVLFNFSIDNGVHSGRFSQNDIKVISVSGGHSYGGDSDLQLGHFMERNKLTSEVYPDETGDNLYFVSHDDHILKQRVQLLMYPVSYQPNVTPVINEIATQAWQYDNPDPDMQNCWKSSQVDTCTIAGVIDHKIAVMQQDDGHGGLNLYFNDITKLGAERFFKQQFTSQELQKFGCDDIQKSSCFFRAGDGELYLRGMPYKWDKVQNRFVRIEWVSKMDSYVYNVIPTKGQTIYLVQKTKNNDDNSIQCVENEGVNPKTLNVITKKVGSNASVGKYSWWKGLAIDPMTCSTVNKDYVGDMHLTYGMNDSLQTFAVPQGVFSQSDKHLLLFYPYPPKGFLNDEQ